MDKNLLSTSLTEIGLTENEAVVYCAALSLGASSILGIARASNIKRTTVYAVVDSLKEKGLMRIEIKGFKNLYAAENPQKLEQIITERHAKLKQLIPQFSALYNLPTGENFIKYYEGVKAVRSVYEELLITIQPKEKYMVIANQDFWIKQDPDYFQKFIERRARLNINIRLLLLDTDLARHFKKFEKNHNQKIKFFPKTMPLATNIVIIPQKIMFQHIVPPITAIVVENKSLIQTHQELFEILWNMLPD